MLFPLSIIPAKCLFPAFVLAGTLFTSVTCAAEIWVISDSQHPVHGKSDRLIELDAPARIEAELSANLPSDPRQASTLVQDRLKDGGPALQQRISSAYQGVADAWSLGVTTIPAVVVDRRYVVYGDSDVARAVSRIEAARRARP